MKSAKNRWMRSRWDSTRALFQAKRVWKMFINPVLLIEALCFIFLIIGGTTI
jgi:hypothetical protein